MSTAKFRNAISEFKRLYPSRTVKTRRDSKNRRVTEFIDNACAEDKLLLELIEKITFENLYKSQEFKVKLLDRVQQLKYGKR